MAPLASPKASLITPGLLPNPPSTSPTSHTSRLPSQQLYSEPTLPTAAQKSAALDSLSSLLLRGEKKQAVQLAMDEKLWAHAMVLSSCIDKQTWGEVVRAFAMSELGGDDAGNKVKRRDALRLTYEMLGGSGSGEHACLGFTTSSHP